MIARYCSKRTYLVRFLIRLTKPSVTGGGIYPLGGLVAGGLPPEQGGATNVFFFRATKKNTPPWGGATKVIFS